MTVFIAAFVGSLIGFLVALILHLFFVSDTGSLTIGGIIAVLAIAVRKNYYTVIVWCIFSRKFICGITG
jgi:phospho-N-acetylmuramoyl-pentapeptide-transferase